MTAAGWWCFAVALLSALISLGFAFAGLRGSEGDARTASKYALARSAAFAVVIAVAPLTGSAMFLAAGALGMTLVQGADTIVGASIRDRQKTFGPAVLAAAGLATLVWLWMSA